jgi:DNA-binding CsgD family transcriptional regulator
MRRPLSQNALRGAGRKWSDEQVAECQRLCAEGLTLYAIQDRTGIPHQTVWTFVRHTRRAIPLDDYQSLEESRRAVA